ncbi:MAG: hypothetical protein P9M10_03185 [Candidatus Euphemobacter frigidus]|nr:hypothetical protein [Candidatus Euphemobacter frigidus]
MIFTHASNGDSKQFETLLDETVCLLDKQAGRRPKYFLSRTSARFENDVFDSMNETAKGGAFEDSIELISGYKFPDIVAGEYYGVEVKSTRQDHWKTTGNSVLESTRIESVERIYILFGKLSVPVGFRFRKYEDCLYDIAITHSPRYLIDMDLGEAKTIFNKVKMPYDKIRKSKNPIIPLISYYRSVAKPGEEPWWMDTGAGEIAGKLTVSLWRNLDAETRDVYRVKGMANFPEIFSNSPTKYYRLATWLAGRHGIVDPSLRDRFTAGGQDEIKIGSVSYKRVPRIFLNLKRLAPQIFDYLENVDPKEIAHHWGLKKIPKGKILDKWVDLLLKNASGTLKGAQKVVIHLLGDSRESSKHPLRLREALKEYKINIK